MEAEEQKAKQTERTTKPKIKDEEIRRRNQQHERTTPDRSKPTAKSGPSPKRLAKYHCSQIVEKKQVEAQMIQNHLTNQKDPKEGPQIFSQLRKNQLLKRFNE